MISAIDRRVVITGMNVITPLGNSVDQLWNSLADRRSGVRRLSSSDPAHPCFTYAGIASDFSGGISDFGQLEASQKKAIRKGLKLMCREIRMGVAAAQLAMQHGRIAAGGYDSERTGVVFGCDHFVTVPDEFSEAIRACVNGSGFEFGRWGTAGLAEVTPLWLLKYLPNMPASHVAIYNDLRGPNNSLSYREPAANAAIAEAFTTIRRGSADRMIAGSTGCSVGPIRSIHFAQQSEVALNGDDPTKACRPFDIQRTGTVAGEGAAALLLEDREMALSRDAMIYGEVLGHGSSVVVDNDSVADIRKAVANAIRTALGSANMSPNEIGHIHAHGIGTKHADRQEALGIRDAIGAAADRVPVTAAKSYFGNLGASSGMVELVASLMAMEKGELFPILNCQKVDPDCPIRPVQSDDVSPGESVLNLSFSPNGQTTALLVKSARG